MLVKNWSINYRSIRYSLVCNKRVYIIIKYNLQFHTREKPWFWSQEFSWAYISYVTNREKWIKQNFKLSVSACLKNRNLKKNKVCEKKKKKKKKTNKYKSVCFESKKFQISNLNGWMNFRIVGGFFSSY